MEKKKKLWVWCLAIRDYYAYETNAFIINLLRVFDDLMERKQQKYQDISSFLIKVYFMVQLNGFLEGFGTLFNKSNPISCEGKIMKKKCNFLYMRN